MAKNLLLQVAIKPKVVTVANPTGQYFDKDMYALSREKAEAYAKKCGVDYHCVDTYEWKEDEAPGNQRFCIFTNENKHIIDYDQYDNIVYCDSDFMWVNELAPNLFELMEKSDHIFFASPDLLMKGETDFTLKRKSRLKLPLEYLYFNSGLLGFKRPAIEAFKPFIEEAISLSKSKRSGKWNDQDALNVMAHRSLGKYGELSRNWNWTFNAGAPLFTVHYLSIVKLQYSETNHQKIVDKKLKRVEEYSIDVSDPVHHWYHPHYSKKNKLEVPTE